MLRRIVRVVFPTVLLILASLTQAQTNNGPVNYIYDDLGRLVAVIDGQGNAAIYAYDAVGNILSISRVTAGQVSIIYFTPSSGPVGMSVTISGTRFSTTANQNTVQFNGTTATVVSATATQIVATVPMNATSGPISVTSPSGSATSSSSFTVTTGSDAPTITGFSPTIGTPGTSVTVTGTNFDPTPGNNHLKFNITSQSVDSVTNTTSIATTVPAQTASGPLSISTVHGTAVSSQDFYIPFPPIRRQTLVIPTAFRFPARRTSCSALPARSRWEDMEHESKDFKEENTKDNESPTRCPKPRPRLRIPPLPLGAGLTVSPFTTGAM